MVVRNVFLKSKVSKDKNIGFYDKLGQKAILGAFSSNLSIKGNNNNANITIDKMKGKIEKGKSLTHQQENMLKSAKVEKITNMAGEAIVNTGSETGTEIVDKKLEENETKKR